MRPALVVLSAVALSALALPACGPPPHVRAVNFRPPRQSSDLATVIFVGRTGFGSAYSVFRDRGRFLGQLGRASWFDAQVPAGRHVFFAMQEAACLGIRAELAPGRTYVLRLQHLNPVVTGGGSLGLAIEAINDLSMEGTPGSIPPSELGLHWRVLRRREQTRMDLWTFLRQRQRFEGVITDGQRAVDAALLPPPQGSLSDATCTLIDRSDAVVAEDAFQ